MLLKSPGYRSNGRASTDIKFTAIDPRGPSVRCKHAKGVSTYTSTNGWQFTKLPRRQSMTEFMGYDGYTLMVPVIFGDGISTMSIEPQLEVLRGMGRNKVGPRVEPAVIQIDGDAVPLNWLRWVINDLKFNDEYRNDDGTRYFAQVDVTFFEWRPTDLVMTKTGLSATQLLVSATSPSSLFPLPTSTPLATSAGIINTTPAMPAPALSTPSSGTYTVKKGDTLQTIAQATLGNASLWQSIAKMNKSEMAPSYGLPINDPTSILVGQVLRLPVGAKVPNPTGVLGQLGFDRGILNWHNWLP